MNKKITKILKNLADKNPDKVLDIGAGNCDISEYFYNNGSEVVIVEPNIGDKCKKMEGATLIRGYIEDQELRKGAYDLVIMRSIIHYLTPESLHKKVLPKIEKSIKKDGFLYIFTMTPPNNSSRFFHSPGFILKNLPSMSLINKEEKHQKMVFKNKEINHMTWELVFRKD